MHLQQGCKLGLHQWPPEVYWYPQLDVCCAMLCCMVSSMQVGDSLKLLHIEILRGKFKEHVPAVLEPNA
jgi:hypothetical protein